MGELETRLGQLEALSGKLDAIERDTVRKALDRIGETLRKLAA